METFTACCCHALVVGICVTFGRCRCSGLLAQLFLCLQDWILKLGFLVDVAATYRTQSIHISDLLSHLQFFFNQLWMHL